MSHPTATTRRNKQHMICDIYQCGECFYPWSPEVEPWVPQTVGPALSMRSCSFSDISHCCLSQRFGECFSTVLPITVMYFIVLYFTVMYCGVLSYTILYCHVHSCTVLYCPMSSFTVLYCPVLSCTVLYHPLLSCTALYCIVL